MMRMIRLTVAIVAVVLLVHSPARADNLLPADLPVEQVVDRSIDAVLHKAAITPVGRADDAPLIRRLTLDLAGRIPTAAEYVAYVASSASDKRARLVDRLIASRGFGRHLAAELETMLMAGNTGSLRDYLEKATGENRPWDQIFRELMLPNQTDKRQNVASAYLRQGLVDLDRLTADVSSTFFGVNISCAQCHDHPLVKGWKQDHFYGMKSFLSRTFVNGTENKAFLGEHDYGTIRFKTTEDVERQAQMMFLTGRRVDVANAEEPSKEDQKKEKESLDRAKKEKIPPPAPKFSARAKLVELALSPGDREFFAKSIINRTWNRLFGQGLVMPLDQMHAANPPSHPELLAWLARDLATHGYDLRRSIRGMVMSEAYARSSRWEGEAMPRPSLFAVALVRPLSPTQLATSLRLATTDPASLSAGMPPERFEQRIASLESSGRGLAASFTSAGGDNQIGVAEALLFSNSKNIEKELLADGPDRLIGRLKQTASHAEIVDLAVRNVLSRSADHDERSALGAYLTQRTDRPEEACQQLVWVLLTCSEFRFNH